MNKKELKAVRGVIEDIYRTWHQCGLSKKDAKAANLEPGRLCDVCQDLANSDVELVTRLSESW